MLQGEGVTAVEKKEGKKELVNENKRMCLC